MSDTVTTTFAVVQGVLLDTAAGRRATPQELQILLAIAELGGEVEGPSHTFVGHLGSNATAIRRAALGLAADGLLTNRSRRGLGLRLELTPAGGELAASMLVAIDKRRAAMSSRTTTTATPGGARA